MHSQLMPKYPAVTAADSRAAENRADIARVVVALGVLALLASFDDAKGPGVAAASPQAHVEAARP